MANRVDYLAHSIQSTSIRSLVDSERKVEGKNSS